MDRESKSDLLKTLESQRDKIHQYETKIKDLVAAYKSQVKENETLRSTVKSLQLSSSRQLNQQNDSEAAVQSSTTDKGQDSTDSAEQIATLTSSLTSLMEEKKSIQTAAIAERKALKQSYDEKLQKLESDCQRWEQESLTSQQLVAELKKKLRTEQLDREREHSDHASMMRELQKRLADQMSERDDFKHQIEDLRKELIIVKQQPVLTDQYEVLIADLTNQLQSMKIKVKEEESKTRQWQSVLSEMQKEIDVLKTTQATNVLKEQKTVEEAESKMLELATLSETRISELEAKISQLSDIVGNYERLRFNDQQAIHNLKERVTQLDQENTALAKVAQPQPDDSNLTVEELTDRLKQLHSSLRLACYDSNTNLDFSVLLADAFADDASMHMKCEAEYSQLKDEFECYKLRAQSVLKSKNSKDSGSTKEMDSLKNTVTELRAKLKSSTETHREEQRKQEQTVQELRSSIANLHASHKQELAQAQHDCQLKIAEVEQRLHQHRDRMIKLLAEKDSEIEALKGHGNMLERWPSSSSDTRPSSEESPLSPIDQILSRDTNGAGPIFHYAQEVARASQDIASLRKQKRELEVQLQEAQESIISKEQQYAEQIAFLKQEIRRQDQSKAREGINLEYLKNIIFQFMICKEMLGKQHIANAITTLLHFSPQERKQVTDILKQ